ncbi:methyl-CpG-binding domain-containing protein 5 [Ziziphus jujuba]|uniref:Methyl-CpG-binding domain-containing protein 5 n=1 Tax=Ziziphus jujuba TaxID=326968 RepID=A0A6P3Z965_ZIZJJ|nr:methyl-CpG-binding domain-containing protein 5 [Ziziphus jujuba]
METPKAFTPRHHKLSETLPEHRGSSNGVRPCSAAENSNFSEPMKKGPENTEFQAGRGKRKVSEQEFNWLPSGWIVEDRVRSSGATAGTVDKYYFHPVSGRRFRSKKEVLYFLETGTPRKKKQTENSDAETKGSGGHKQKSSAAAKSSTLNFDFSNVPEKVNWVLSDSPEGSWTPYIGDDMVAESGKQEWEAAFKFLTSRNSGRNY